MQMYEVTALAPEGSEEVYQAMVFAEDEDDALNQLEEQLKEQGIAHGMCHKACHTDQHIKPPGCCIASYGPLLYRQLPGCLLRSFLQ